MMFCLLECVKWGLASRLESVTTGTLLQERRELVHRVEYNAVIVDLGSLRWILIRYADNQSLVLLVLLCRYFPKV